jgi:hypothetical protein
MVAEWQLALCFAPFGDVPGAVVVDPVAVIDKHVVKLRNGAGS